MAKKYDIPDFEPQMANEPAVEMCYSSGTTPSHVNMSFDVPQTIDVHVFRDMMVHYASWLINSKECLRKNMAVNSIDQFFGGWNDDPRSTEEIKSDIQTARTENTFFTRLSDYD